MQPGDLTERESLQAQYLQLSTRISQAEFEYNEAGVIFYTITICDDPPQGDNTTYFRQAFWADADNTLIPNLHSVRQLREQAQTFLRGNNFSEASRCLEDLDAKLESITDEIIALEVHIQGLGSEAMPSLTKGNLLNWFEQTDIENVCRNARFREWVLKLLEIESGLELGTLENAEMAVRGIFEVEERLV